MSTDYLSYLRAPGDINKIHYSQEIGMQFGERFVPITEESLRTVNCFVMCWPRFNDPWLWNREFSGWGEHCPHCDGDKFGPTKLVSPYDIWE